MKLWKTKTQPTQMRKKKTTKKAITKVDKPLRKNKSVVPKTVAALLLYPTITEAAEKLDISRQALYERIEKYQLRPVLDAIPQQAMDTLKMSSLRAAEAIIEELGNKDVTVKLEVAREVLDRVGVRAKPEAPAVAVQVNNIVEQASKEADKFIVDAEQKD